MDRVEYLKQESISDCVAYTEFMLDYKKNNNTLYCFFEGNEDKIYYSFRIEHLLNEMSQIGYVCGGKTAVIKVRQLIKNNPGYRNVKTGFFIDKDYDAERYSSEYYVTPTYSVENLYTLKETIEEILTNEFKMNKNSDDFKKCMEMYLSLKREFLQSTLVLNAWLACQADYRKETNIITNLYIDKRLNTYFDRLILTDMSRVKDMPEIQIKDQIQQIFSDSPIVDDEKLRVKIEIFGSVNQVEVFRGKFLLKFLENFFSRLQSIMGHSCMPFGKKYSCNIRFECATMCSTLCQYVKTTPCLKGYLRQFN